MKRVLFICSQPFFQWRGSPIRVGFDVTALAQIGYEVDFLTLPIGERREIPGVNMIRVPNVFRARNISIGPSALKAAFDVLLFFKAVALLHARRYEVVHCVEDTGAIGVAVAWLGNARLVFEKHSDPSSYRSVSSTLRNLIMWLYAKVERFVVLHADAVIGTGPGLVEQVRAMHIGKPVHHIFDIPSSLVEADPARTHAIQARLKQSSREILATYVGSFASYQGIDLLFEAILRVVKACPNIRFVIIGGSEREIRERTAWLRERGAESAVTWAGWIAPDELANWLAASDILLSPRLTGVNTPLKLLDYLKAAKAIVATDTPANRLLLDESNALLIAAEPGAFADGICRLAGDPGWRARLAATGATLIRSRYNFDEFKRGLEKCYAELTPKAPRRPPNRRLLLRLAFSACLAFVLLEVGLAWMCATGRLKIQRPSYCLATVWSRFWVDSNPYFGVWHDPHSIYKHMTPEIRLIYRANAHGMRDRDRDLAGHGRKRVVILGDSFMEGWGVATESRLSDRLERATGLEHLNFGVSGSFGPTQSYLLYEHLARTFEHDAVIFAILPDNDFLDDDYEYGLKMHKGRYRPFFLGKDPDYKLVYTPLARASTVSRIIEQALRQFTYTGNLIKYMKSMARHQQADVPSDYAGYFDFTSDQWARLKKVLSELRRAAGDKPILVLTIPCDTDILRSERVGEPPLPAKLRDICRDLKMQYVDLLPPIRADKKGWQTCYLKTDRHWNAHGNEVAAKAVLASAEFYRTWNVKPNATPAGSGAEVISSSRAIAGVRQDQRPCVIHD